MHHRLALVTLLLLAACAGEPSPVEPAGPTAPRTSAPRNSTGPTPIATPTTPRTPGFTIPGAPVSEDPFSTVSTPTPDATLETPTPPPFATSTLMPDPGEILANSGLNYQLGKVQSVAVAPDGTAYAIDGNNGSLLKIEASGPVTRFANIGAGTVQQVRVDLKGQVWLSSGDGGGVGRFDDEGTWTQRAAASHFLTDFAVAGDGTIYMVEVEGATTTVERVTPGGLKTVVYTGTGRQLVAIDATNRVYLAGSGTLRKYVGTSWQTVLADSRFDFGDSGTVGMCLSPKGQAIVASTVTDTIIACDLATKAFTGIAGSGGKHLRGEAGTTETLIDPFSPCFDQAGNLYWADTGRRRVNRLAANTL